MMYVYFLLGLINFMNGIGLALVFIAHFSSKAKVEDKNKNVRGE